MCYEMGIREDDDDAFELAGINPTRHQPTDY
jgi:hypothetical protein